MCGCPTRTQDMDAAGEAHKTRVPVCDSPHAGSLGVPGMQRDAALSPVSTPWQAHRLCIASVPNGLLESRQCPAGRSQWQSLSPQQAGLLPSLSSHLLLLGNLSPQEYLSPPPGPYPTRVFIESSRGPAQLSWGCVSLAVLLLSVLWQPMPNKNSVPWLQVWSSHQYAKTNANKGEVLAGWCRWAEDGAALLLIFFLSWLSFLTLLQVLALEFPLPFPVALLV